MRPLALFLWVLAAVAIGQEISLVPVDPAELDAWAQAVQPLRLFPTSPTPVRFEGPALALRLFGEITLGEARYPFLLGVTPQNQVQLWLDKDRDGRLVPEEALPQTRAAEAVVWTTTLDAELGDRSFPYPLQIVWPEGRSYVFLVGGAPRRGAFYGRTIVVVDGDVDGVFGTKGDFLGVDVDGDGRIYAEPDGHERFGLTEPFTLEGRSYRLQWIAPDGGSLALEEVAYVPPKVPLIPGAPAPDFDFRNFRDGQALSLSRFRGKVVLLDFWATWCPPCMAALPGVRALYEEFHPQGFEIVGVSLDESAEDLRRILETYNIPWPNAFSGRRWDNPVANLYRVYQIPTTYLLDRRGVIRFRDLHGEELRAAVQALLAEPFEPEGSDAQVLPAPLSLTVPDPIRLAAQGMTKFSVEFVNGSAFPVEEVEVGWEGLPAGLKEDRSPRFSLAPGERKTLDLCLVVENVDPKAFPHEAVLVVSYSPAAENPVHERIVLRASVRLVLVEEPSPSVIIPWWMWGLLALGLALVVLVLGKGGLFLLPISVVAIACRLGGWLSRI